MSNPIYVTSLEDDATKAGTLRYAVAQVNAGLYDSIIISSSLSGQTIELLSGLTVAADTTIKGTNVKISGASLTASGDIELSGLRFELTETDYGILLTRNDSTLTLDSSIKVSRESDGDLAGVTLQSNILASTINLSDAVKINVDNGGEGNAYGIDISHECKDISCTVSGFSGEITVHAANGHAIGITTGTTEPGLGSGSVTMGDLSGKITVSGTASTKGCHGIYGGGSSDLYFTVGNISGDISVEGIDTGARGIWVDTLYSNCVVTTGNISGSITAVSSGGDGETVCIASYGWFRDSVTIGDISGILTASNVSADAWAIRSASFGDASVTVGNISGQIAATSQEKNAYGIMSDYYSGWSGSKIITLGDITGSITAASANGAAQTLYTRMLSTTGYDGSFLLNGTLIADGKSKDSKVIRVTEAFTGTINGTIAAGYFRTTESKTGMTDFAAGLKSKEKTTIEKAAAGCNGYYSITGGDNNDTITVNSGALVFGGFSLGAGTNNVTISTGARMYGNLTADTMNLQFNVDALTANVALTVTEDGIFGTDNGTYSLVVGTGAEMTDGSYNLVSGLSVNAMTGKVFTVYDTNGTKLSDLTVDGKGQEVHGYKLSLYRKESNLCLSVESSSAPVIVSTITGNFNGKGSAFQLMSDGTAYVRSNTAKKMLDETIDVSKWQVVDSGDFGATGEDGLLWLEKSTGYVYMQYDMTSFAEVNNKTNCLGVLGEGYSIKAAGDFTGNGISGALLQGPEFGVKSFSLNYGLPVWARNDDGSTFPGWLGALVNTWQEGDPLKGDLTNPASINANNYQYKLVGVGDFNGDGRDDVMIQNTMPEVVTEKGVDYTITGSGDVFTFLTGSKDAVKRGDAPTVCYAGCATDGWEVLGFGDFNADGIDDTLLSDGTGLAGWQMANGQRQDNFWFGNLDTNNEFAGIADFNNDGTDDILIRNTATETLTAWTVKDGAVTGAIALR